MAVVVRPRTNAEVAATAATVPIRKAYIGLGANLGAPRRQLESALRQIATLPRVQLLATSRLYRSAPLGGLAQPDYCNAVCVVATTCTAADLLRALQDIETAAGRTRDGERWASRRLDLDLLHIEGEHYRAAALSLPHPHLHERNFVLVPLLEIAPTLCIDGLGPLSELAAAHVDDGLAFWDDAT